MRFRIFIFLFLLPFAWSCSSKSSEPLAHTVRYDVTASNYTTLSVAYINEDGQLKEGYQDSGWHYEFTTSVSNFHAQADVFARNQNDLTADVTAKITITVDGQLVKTDTHTAKTEDMSSDPLASVSYVIP